MGAFFLSSFWLFIKLSGDASLCGHTETMELTPQQQRAFEHFTEVMKTNSVFLLQGFAGTGKTTLTKHIVKYFSMKRLPICAIAPTHKAKRVIEAMVNHKQLFPVPAFTIASIMGKIREHSYIGTKKYSNPNNKKFTTYKIFLLDEVSMVADNDLRFIIDYVIQHNKKLLIIGDNCQIPCPSAPYKVVGNAVVKCDSFVFEDASIPTYELTEVVRQAEGSPVLQLTSYVRNHINGEFTIFDTGYGNVMTSETMYTKFEELYRDSPTTSKIIAYTNQAVYTHNVEVRAQLGYEDKIVEGELLTGYASLGFPELIIENGQDYVVAKCRETSNHAIDQFRGLYGHVLDLQIVNTPIITRNLFFIEVAAEENNEFLTELIRRSDKVNAFHSTKMDYVHYCELKNRVIFMEDVYKYNDAIYKEADFKDTHILLFSKVTELIKDGVIQSSKLVDKIQTAYPGLLERRVQDVRKPIGDSETLADQFKCIEKDIYYGYAITAHKSQGSTYQHVMVDENDFSRIQDRMNFQFGKLEKRTREKNQLRYVAYSRAKGELVIVSNDTP